MILIKKNNTSMQKISLLKSNYKLLLLAVVSVFSFSCENEFNNSGSILTEGNAEPPTILSVSEAREDKVVTQGVLENTYIIRGTNLNSITKIMFNGIDASFNSALGTETLAFARISEDSPVVSQSNTLVVETLGGSATLDFSLLFVEEDFTEGTTAEGLKTVTLFGGDFTDTSNVTFASGTEEAGNLVERPANILSIDQAEITVEVPAGVEQAFIFIETSRGAIVQSASFGFSYSIFIDALNADWTAGGFSQPSPPDLMATEFALGEFSIKSESDLFGAISLFSVDPAGIDISDYESVSIQVYSENSNKLKFALNDFANSDFFIDLVPGQWNKFVIDLDDFYPTGGRPDRLFRIDFQESSFFDPVQPGPFRVYIDDFGFL